jgi:hypothetical protein
MIAGHDVGITAAGRAGVRPIQRSTDPLLAKPDRAGALPAETVNSPGHGQDGVVRECPLATDQDCCEWQACGTAGGDGPHTVAPLVST